MKSSKPVTDICSLYPTKSYGKSNYYKRDRGVVERIADRRTSIMVCPYVVQRVKNYQDQNYKKSWRPKKQMRVSSSVHWETYHLQAFSLTVVEKN